MPSPLSAIIRAMHDSLKLWAEDVEGAAGVVSIAADEEEGLDLLAESPRAWRLILWAGGEAPKAAVSDELVATTIRLGVSMARGLKVQPGLDLIQGRGNMPPILDVIEGVIRRARGLHVSVATPPLNATDCYLLRYRGWEWVSFIMGAKHHSARIDFTLDRQIQQRDPLRVVL